MPEPPAGVKPSTQTGRRMHRPDPALRPLEDDADVACPVHLRTDRAEWRWVHPVTNGKLAFVKLCSRCFPALTGEFRCQQCGADLERRTQSLVREVYVVKFACPACGQFGGLALDTVTGEAVNRQGPALVERERRTRQQQLVTDGGLDLGVNARAVVEFLAASPDQAFMRHEIRDGTDIPDGSIGPTLVRLEERGLVDHRGEYWSLADRVAASLNRGNP